MLTSEYDPTKSCYKNVVNPKPTFFSCVFSGILSLLMYLSTVWRAAICYAFSSSSPRHSRTMKVSVAAILLAASGASAYSVSRSSIRSLGQRNVASTSAQRKVRGDLKMEGA